MAEISVQDKMVLLIDAERAALLEGNFGRIADLLDEKKVLIDGLEASEPHPETLAAVKDGMRRNHELFDHTLAGLRTVVARLGAIESHAKTLDTYDADGRRMTIEATANRIERRA